MGREKLIGQGGASSVVDDTLFPFLIATWFGAPDDELIRFYFDWQAKGLARARAAGIKVVTVIDGIDAARPPSTIRKTIADCSTTILEEFDPYIVHSWVVVHSPLLRGVITAIMWMVPMRLSTAPTCTMALEDAARALVEAGVSLPENFSAASYVRPTEPGVEKISWTRSKTG